MKSICNLDYEIEFVFSFDYEESSINLIIPKDEHVDKLIDWCTLRGINIFRLINLHDGLVDFSQAEEVRYLGLNDNFFFDKNIKFYFNPLELVSSNKKLYIGYISNDDFKFRKRRKIFDFNPIPVITKGKFIQIDKALLIKTTLNSLTWPMALYYFCLLLIYSMFYCCIFYV